MSTISRNTIRLSQPHCDNLLRKIARTRHSEERSDVGISSLKRTGTRSPRFGSFADSGAETRDDETGTPPGKRRSLFQNTGPAGVAPARTASSERVGFTLIELLIVVAIIGILAGIAIPNFLSAQLRARVAQCKMDLRTIGQAVHQYHLDHNRFPQRFADEHSFFAQTIAPMLTTPVAYLSSPSVKDPFGPVEEAPAPTGLEENRFVTNQPLPRNSYVYVPYQLFSLWQANPKLDRDAYLVASIGPDRVDSALVYLPFPEMRTLPIPCIQDTVYSPSNGVISGGDIGHFGGAVPLGGGIGG
ncbi:MAG TPA: prepilin-type N-terminal cleavage/methylation domain-containing protein [bacterium]|nr:prepilin-type N-terminal cleavage/methylation domain-containing protein [bacterium]